MRSVKIIFLIIDMSAVESKCDGVFAPAHIMISSPALPCLDDVVWVYIKNIITNDHQSFRIII